MNMAIHKLDLGEFDEIDYYLFAIHTALEDYRLAFFINQKLQINLSKSKNEIQINIKEGETKFSRLSYHDKKGGVSWDLIQNKNEVTHQRKANSPNLFSNLTQEVSTKVYLLPEFKKVDYFLKIENNEDIINATKIQILLNKIDNVATVYSVDMNQIKSKNNLIF
jgi:hypothetical protein